MSKAVALDCNYTNSLTNTGHSAWCCSISAAVNAGVGLFTVKQFMCHTKIDQSTTYHESNDVNQIRVSIAMQGLDVNDTLNVADDGGYNNVGDDDDIPTQGQTQPSQRGCHPNLSSHNNQSITSPDRKRSKSRNCSPTGSRSPAFSHSSYKSRHHHYYG